MEDGRNETPGSIELQITISNTVRMYVLMYVKVNTYITHKSFLEILLSLKWKSIKWTLYSNSTYLSVFLE